LAVSFRLAEKRATIAALKAPLGVSGGQGGTRVWAMKVRPAVALDVDGVLMPWLRPEYGGWLLALADRADLVWATSWEYSANWHIGPVIGLPELPVIEFPALVKLPVIETWCGARPLAWLDDFFEDRAYAWAAGRTEAGTPTLLVPVDSAAGLQPGHCEAVSAWLDATGSVRPGRR
jgi:hypothetical protein